MPGHLLHEKVAHYTRLACEQVTGDVLVFLPGMGAINKVAQLLNQHTPSSQPVIHQLYGAATKDAQTSALRPDPNGRQKVILATNVAETSLTIENIEAVIDSGMENVAVFNPVNGYTQLNQQMISQASATQRKGRAGRLRPGICYRMWSKEQQDRLAAYALPQILREDVTGVLLEALSWGTQLSELAMLDQPSAAQTASAVTTLQQVGAVTQNTASTAVITNYGRELASLPCHPRLAHMLSKSCQNIATHGPGLFQAAVWVAALAEDSGKNQASTVSEALVKLDSGRLKRLRNLANRYWTRLISSSADYRLCAPHDLHSEDIALAIAFAYEDHLAYWQNGQWKMANGRGAEWVGRVPDSKWLAVLDGQQIGSQVKIRLAEALTEKTVKTWFKDGFEQSEEVSYDPQQAQMQARKITRFHQILLNSEPVAGPGKKAIAVAWLKYLRTLDDNALPLSEPARQWLHRLRLAVQLDLPQPQAFDLPEPWPQTSQSVLSLLDEGTLLKQLALCKRWDDVSKIGWRTLLQQSLPWPQQHALEHFLPEMVTVPVGNKRALNYRADGQVILAVKMQEMYGSTESISVGHEPYPVTLSLLSPAGRPLQMTRDLAAFWQGSYQQIKKEMKGRYPKHYWPDDPASATPTTRTKKYTD